MINTVTMYNNPFDNNKHATTKTSAMGLLNIALLTSNANQLKITIAAFKNKTNKLKILFQSINDKKLGNNIIHQEVLL